MCESSLRELGSMWAGKNQMVLLGFPKSVEKIHSQKFEKLNCSGECILTLMDEC